MQPGLWVSYYKNLNQADQGQSPTVEFTPEHNYLKLSILENPFFVF